jgi:hypothetical protein
MQPNTLTGRAYEVEFMLRIEKIHIGSETNLKKDPDPDLDPKKSFRIHNTGH